MADSSFHLPDLHYSSVSLSFHELGFKRHPALSAPPGAGILIKAVLD
jgi:hypothetical protein